MWSDVSQQQSSAVRGLCLTKNERSKSGFGFRKPTLAGSWRRPTRENPCYHPPAITPHNAGGFSYRLHWLCSFYGNWTHSLWNKQRTPESPPASRNGFIRTAGVCKTWRFHLPSSEVSQKAHPMEVPHEAVSVCHMRRCTADADSGDAEPRTASRSAPGPNLAACF